MVRAMGTTVRPEIIYPETDGQPMAENTVQFKAIVALVGNLETLFADRPDVFVAGDLFWYPVEGHPEIRQAPDALVVFGRPKGHRRSYLQWLEGNIAPQVVFEVASPSNTEAEWRAKLQFYDQYGVEEYYLYDPDTGNWKGWLRRRGALRPIRTMVGWVSPRLGIRFGRGYQEEVGVSYPDGSRFLGFLEVMQRWREARRAQEEAERRAEQLAQRLRELGVDPDQV